MFSYELNVFVICTSSSVPDESVYSRTRWIDKLWARRPIYGESCQKESGTSNRDNLPRGTTSWCLNSFGVFNLNETRKSRVRVRVDSPWSVVCHVDRALTWSVHTCLFYVRELMTRGLEYNCDYISLRISENWLLPFERSMSTHPGEKKYSTRRTYPRPVEGNGGMVLLTNFYVRQTYRGLCE